MIHKCSGKSLKEWYQSAPGRFVVDPGPEPWWYFRNFSEQKATGSFLHSSELQPNTRYQVFPAQLRLLPGEYSVPSVAEAVDLLMSNVKILIGEWTRTRHLIKKGGEWSVVCVGVSRTGLVDVYDYYANRKASTRVGILPIQRLIEEKEE